MKKFKLALLNLYNGHPNQGMRCIRNIIENYAHEVDYREFDVRDKNELPDSDYDIYISSGGPGDPTDMNNGWIENYNMLIDELWQHNAKNIYPGKHAFFICHSFQLITNHFELGDITKRKSTAFGVFPIHKTVAGKNDPLLENLPDPHYAVDSRDYQLSQPNLEVFEKRGAAILSLEKIRTHAEYERAIMAVRFSDEFVGTQYHLEADADGMKIHFSKAENREKVVKNFSKEKYEGMLRQLDDPEKVALTHRTILPNFIEQSVAKLKKTENEKSTV